VKMDNGKSVSFDTQRMRHFDHGYAVTSHSSQGLTAERVLVNIDLPILVLPPVFRYSSGRVFAPAHAHLGRPVQQAD
jgi:hypothetical protein